MRSESILAFNSGIHVYIHCINQAVGKLEEPLSRFEGTALRRHS